MPRLPIHSIAFELTLHCNLRCSHCYNATHGTPEASRDPDRVLLRMEKVLAAVAPRYATLTGGEPLSFPRLFEVIAILEREGVPCQMISNGTLLDAELAARLAKAGLRGIQLSLHGPDASTHEDYTCKPGSFDRTIAGVRAAREVGLPVTGCVVITRRNAQIVGETLSLWRDLGIRRVALSRFSPAGLAADHVARLLPSIPDVVTAFDQALPFARDDMHLFCTMPVPPCAFDSKDYAPIRFGCCAVGTSKQEFALGPSGELRFCTLHTQAIGGVQDILEAEDVAALFQHDDVTRYRDHSPSFCEGCLHTRTCGGGCGAASISVHGSRACPDPLLWQHLDDDFQARLERSR